MFGELCDWAGDFDMNLMATPASVHKTWVMGRCTGTDLPFYSRYGTQGCAGVDVLSQNVKRNIPTRMLRFLFSTHKHGRGAAAASRRMRGKGSGGASGSKAILVSPLSQRHCPV